MRHHEIQMNESIRGQIAVVGYSKPSQSVIEQEPVFIDYDRWWVLGEEEPEQMSKALCALSSRL